jgi:hypothetical protein
MRMSLERFEELSRVAILPMKTRYKHDANATRENETLNAHRSDEICRLTAKLESYLSVAERGDF